MPSSRYDDAQLHTARQQWLPWCTEVSPREAELAVDEVLRYLQVGLRALVIAALIRTRLGRAHDADREVLKAEHDHCLRTVDEVGQMTRWHLIPATAMRAITTEYAGRLAALAESAVAIKSREPVTVTPSAASTELSTSPAAVAAGGAPDERPIAASVPVPGFSLAELVSEHSVVILASIGAFLLVVATVLFELYATLGFGGVLRLGAVIVLTVVFAVGGYVTIRNERLKTVGQIYIALAAVLLPLIALAAWTFLSLGRHGITVDQALAVTGSACAVVYGMLAVRLHLRAYAEMAAVAVLVAAWGISAASGNEWRAVGLGLTPFVYAAAARLARAPEFSHFKWFAHGAVVIALGTALETAETDNTTSSWLAAWTLLAIGAAYLAWQAIDPERSRAWIGEAAVVLAAAAAALAWGMTSFHFLLPLVPALAVLVLSRIPATFGSAGTLYRAHPAHIHLAIAATVFLALVEVVNGEVCNCSGPIAAAPAIALWLGTGLYALDFVLARDSTVTGLTLRAMLPLALLATGEAAHWHAWTASAVALAGLAYLLPYRNPLALRPLVRWADAYFYAAFLLTVFELRESTVGPGQWAAPAALVLWAAIFSGAAGLAGVRLSALASRTVFSGAWFLGVEAVGAHGWRGPADALLALFYTALAQIRPLARYPLASVRRRELVHVASAASIGLCFLGPEDLLWWRLAIAFALVAAAYWWQALARTEVETPWLAWGTLAAASISLTVAVVAHTWQAPVIAAGGLALTGGWAAARRREWIRRPLDEAALPILGALVAIAIGLSVEVTVFPSWQQTLTIFAAAVFLLAWWYLRQEQKVVAQCLRAGASLLGSAAVLIAAGVLQLSAPVVGLVVLAIAAGHAAWAAKATGDVERWYAPIMVLAAVPVLFLWPFSQSLPGVMAIEFVALAALWVPIAVIRRFPVLLVPLVLVIVPAVVYGVEAFGVARGSSAEFTAIAALAGAGGVSGLVVRTRVEREWAWALEEPAAVVAVVATAALFARTDLDVAGIAFLAYGVIVYTAGAQEKSQWYLPAAMAVALAGMFTLLDSHQADTLLYVAALGLLGLLVWSLGTVMAPWLGGHHALVAMHRYLGLGLLVVAAFAGFAFPDRTGPASRGAALAAAALLVAGLVFWLDALRYERPQNLYLGAIVAAAAGYFLARGAGVKAWELVLPGLGLIGAGLQVRQETRFRIDRLARQVVVAAGLALVVGWAATETVIGDVSWLVILLVEGAVTVAAGITLRSRVLLVGGAAVLALASLRAMLTIAQAGYLFIAFGAVALTLIVAATALAMARGRGTAGGRGLRSRLSEWE